MAEGKDRSKQSVTSTRQGGAVLSARWYLDKSKYPQRNGNKFKPYFSGQEIFNALAESIKNAKQTLDIVCWGFDPAMPITRSAGVPWHEGVSYGGQLKQAAARGVKVRLLIWYTQIGNKIQENVPGRVAANPSVEVKFPRVVARSSMVRVKRGSQIATEYAEKWFNEVFTGKQPNIKVVFRDIKDQGSLGNSEDGRTRGESVTLSYPTDHQKSFVADYGFDGAHGYVMGHNSLTAYWDTVQMLHDTDWREYNHEKGHRNGPFHDFSLRVEGPCLIDLNHNFCESWDDNCDRYPRSKGDKISAARRNLNGNMLSSKGSAGGQIVRTRPDKQVNGGKEKEIRRAYMQFAANPRRYILIVNQYFQYARWVREIKRHFSAAKRQGAPRQIYIFAFTPEPEKGGMLFRTHQMANELGVSGQVGKGDSEFYQKQADGSYRLTEEARKERAAHKQAYQDLQAIGIETVFCNLKTQVSGQKPKDIYIHAKLTVIDDDFFTLGSANLNMRSMAVDSELNIISDDAATALSFRRTLLQRYSGGEAPQPAQYGDMQAFFEKFQELAIRNQGEMKKKQKITGHAVPFADSRSAAGLRVA